MRKCLIVLLLFSQPAFAQGIPTAIQIDIYKQRFERNREAFESAWKQRIKTEENRARKYRKLPQVQ